MVLDVAWRSIEERLQKLAEGAATPDPQEERADQILHELDLIDDRQLTSAGERLYIAKFVLHDPAEAAEALAEVLTRQPVVTAFCERLWPASAVPVEGAVNLLKRLTGFQSDTAARRWLNLMNQARLVAYNRANPKMRVLYNPTELVPPGDGAERERDRGHVISPETPYGNLLALRELIRAARLEIRWYDQHLPDKVMEVLYRELDGEHVSKVRLLSGPANITPELKNDFKQFRKEMAAERRIDVAWRVLSRGQAFRRHDRFFITEGFARNLPPLNTILAGNTGEILPSEMTPQQFDEWWAEGTNLDEFDVEEQGD